MAELILPKKQMQGDDRRFKVNFVTGANVWETVRFGLVGASSMVVFQIAFVALDRLGWRANSAAIASYFGASVFHFSAHRYFTFKKARHSPIHGQLFRYACGFAINYSIVAAALNLLLWLHVPKYYASFCSITASLASSYLLQKFFVYRP